MCSVRGEFKKAIEYHKLYLSITKELGDKEDERIAYSSLGIAFYKLGDFKQALQYHNLHLRMAKEARNKAEEGSAYCNLGHAFHGLSDFKKAEEYHSLDLAIAKEIDFNSKLKPTEILRTGPNRFEDIRRAQTFGDYFATMKFT